MYWCWLLCQQLCLTFLSFYIVCVFFYWYLIKLAHFFSGPLPFSTTPCPTSLTTAPATSSNTETTTLPPRRPTTSAWLIPSRWKPRTRWGTERPLFATCHHLVTANSHSPFVLDPQVDYMKYLPVNLVSSHPHYDKDGNAYNMGTSIAEKGKTKYMLFKVPAVSATGK